MSVIAACRWWRPSLYLQLRPWVPRLSTSAPQWWQGCDAQMAVLSLSPTEILSVLSSIFRPSEVMGRACNQAPDPWAIVAKSLARAMSWGALFRRDSAEATATGWSQFFSWLAPVPVGGLELCPLDHLVKATSTNGEGVECRSTGRMDSTRTEMVVVGARKADGATCIALCAPKLPNFTGKVACNHAWSSLCKSVLVTLLTIDGSVVSYTSSLSDKKQGAVLRRYIPPWSSGGWPWQSQLAWVSLGDVSSIDDLLSE